MTFGTAFVLRTRHKQTLPATRKAKTMFFQAKKNSRKTTRQTLSTEQLEPKAMFNAAPLQAEIGFEDRLSGDYDVNDAVLQVRSSQNVTCNTGFSGGGNHICNADSIWTTGGASTLRIGGQSGPGGTTFMTGDDGRSIVHPNYNVGEDGRSIVHPQYNVGEETLPTGTIISHEDSHLSAKDLIGQPPDPKIAPPAPHVSDRAAVIDGGSDSYTEVEWTYFASRQEVFARMGR